MPPSIRRTASKKPETGKYLFYKDRLASFKKFDYDYVKNARCTSEAVARAGFYFTSSQSGKCPFCLKELEFEAEDDPWEEHQSRGADCEFVRIGKLDDSTLSLADVIKLLNHIIAFSKCDEQNKLLLSWADCKTTTTLAEKLTELVSLSSAKSTGRGPKL